MELTEIEKKAEYVRFLQKKFYSMNRNNPERTQVLIESKKEEKELDILIEKKKSGVIELF